MISLFKKGFLAIITIIFVNAWLGINPVFSEMSNYELEQEVRALKKQLKEREGMFDKIGDLKILSDRLSFSGLIEVEANVGDNFDGDSESDIVLATVELAIDAQINEWVNGHILLLWEEDDTEPIDVDEGIITIGNMEKYPVYLAVGKLYVPFGNFESNMIQDSLTLELGETRESAVQVGFELAGFYGSVYAFNGDIKEINDSEKVECYGASMGYGFENDDISFDVGLDWINNIADSDGLTDALNDFAGIDEIDEYVGGLAAHLIVNFGPVMLIGEYVGAIDDFEEGELAAGRKMNPESWNAELAFTNEVMGKEATFALGYQGTNDAVGALPEDRYLAAISVEILENTFLALEYLHDDDYSKGSGGTSGNADVVTAQLAIEF